MDKEKMTKNFIQNFERGAEIMRGKNSDYSKKEEAFGNFERVSAISGISTERVFIGHLANKLVRIENLVTKAEGGEKNAVKDESVEDTLLDLINYTNLMLCYMQAKRED